MLRWRHSLLPKLRMIACECYRTQESESTFMLGIVEEKYETPYI